MVNIDLDNIEFYAPDPPPGPRGAFQPIISTGMPTGNHVAFTLPSAVPVLSKISTQTKMPGYLECSFTSAEAPALTNSTVQHRPKSLYTAPSDTYKLLDWPEVSGIDETIDRTDDDSLDSLLSWVSEEPCWTLSPGSSFLPLEDVEQRSNLSDEILFVPQSPSLDDGESVAVSASPASPASLPGAASSAVACDPYISMDRLGPDDALAPARPHIRPDASLPSTCSTPQPEQDSKSSGTVPGRGRSARRPKRSPQRQKQSVQKQMRSDPQSPRHARIEVVIPSSRRARDSPTLEIPDSQGSTRRRSSLECGGERRGSPDIERADSIEDNDPTARPVKRRRVTSRSSADRHHRPTVPAYAARQSADGPTRRGASRRDISEGGKGADPALVQPSHRKSGAEPGQNGRVASSLHIADHLPRSAEEAMTLASAVAHKLFSLLIAGDVVVPSHGESESRHMGPHDEEPRFEERVSDRGGTWTRWSKEDDKKLLSLRQKNTPWKEIEKSFPRRTLGSLRQRYSTLRNRSLTGDPDRRRLRKSK